jgi:putative transposase
MKERVKFVLEWERRWNEMEGQINMSELCRVFGISRETGYHWVRRYQEGRQDVRAVEERSRRPHTSPSAIPPEVQDIVVAARKKHPRWGPRKLRAWLVRRHPEHPFPSASAMSTILTRRGLTTPRGRRRRRPIAGVTAPFAECMAANDVWCIDFKGWFRTEDGAKCYPLTITDAFTRYLIRCEVVADPDSDHVQRVFDSALLEFGVPKRLRSDNGPPFASTGAGSLTCLAVWWLQLGITLERIQPGKPQQNGRHERMHLTLKIETQPEASLAAQQRAFDVWRREYNQERPHEALDNQRPADLYVRSPRTYPRRLITAEPVSWAHTSVVDKDGFIMWQRRKVFISTALVREPIELERVNLTAWEVHYGPIVLGRLDESRVDRGLIITRRKKGAGKVSTMSLR